MKYFFPLFTLNITPSLTAFQNLMEHWLTDWLAGWLAVWLAGWLAGWLTDWLTNWLTDWLNHRRCSVKKGALRNFAKIVGKRLSQSLVLNKGWPATSFKKETLAQGFSCEISEISKNTSSYEHLRWLLLLFPDMVLRNRAK